MFKQIFSNISANILSFFVNVGVSLMLTPFLVKNLGISAYGLIPLAMFLTTYIGIITQSLTSSINRYLTESITKKDEIGSRSIFSTSLYMMVFFVLIQLLIIYYPVINISKFITIPENIHADAIKLFLLVILSFSISLITSVFSVSMYAKNRLDLMQYSNIFRNIIKLISIYLLFSLNKINLVSVGVSIVLSSSFCFFYAIYYWVKLTPDLSVNIKYFDYSKIKSLSSLGGWILINQIGFILFSKVDLILINKFLGPDSSGNYAIANQLSDLIKSLAGILAGVLGPVVMIYYSQNKIELMTKISNIFVKLMSVLISIPIVLLCVFSNDILLFWLGKDFVHLSSLIWFVTLPLIINLGVLPIFSIQVAMNKVKFPGILSLILGIGGVVSSIILLRYTNLGVYGVAVSSLGMLTIKNAIFIPLYAAHILNIDKYTFIRVHLKTIIFSFFMIICGFFVKFNFEIKSLIELLLVCMILGAAFVFMSIFLYSQEEKNELISFIRSKINK